MSDQAVARRLADEIAVKTTEANEAWTAFDTARKSAIAEGVDFASNTEAFDRIDELSKSYDAKRDEIAKLETRRQSALGWPDQPKADRREDDREREERSTGKGWGQAFLDSDIYEGLKASRALDTPTVRINTDGLKVADVAELKTLLSSSGASAGDLVVNDRKDIVALIPKANLTILDAVTVGDTDSDTVEYVVETTMTNAAAEVAEDTAAPEATLVYEDVQAFVRDIAVWIPATRRILADAGQLRTLVDGRLSYMVRARLQTQLISGDGTGENLLGLVNTAGISAQALGALSRADAVHKAITKVRVAAEGVFEPVAIGMHPNDAEELFLEKDAYGQYYFGGPGSGFDRTVWGLRPIVQVAFPEGNPVVGDFKQLILWLREGVVMSMSDSHSDFFTKRKVAVMATLRAAAGVPQPKAFCELTGF
jgi:HK97 family phage major capsid protein